MNDTRSGKVLHTLVSAVLDFSVSIRNKGNCPFCGTLKPHGAQCPLQVFALPMREAITVLTEQKMPATDEEAAALWESDQDLAAARMDGLVHAAFYKALVENGMPPVLAGNLTALWSQHGC